jgi:aryl-alcohol dehydrogenase-like predicted oxidoreductase
VTSVIPGARNVAQAVSNAAAGEADVDLSGFDAAVHDVYDRLLRADIHPQW